MSALPVETYSDADLPETIAWQAVSFIRISWPFVDGGIVRRPYGPEGEPIHCVIHDRGMLISYATVVRLRLEHAGQTFDARGLANVMTFPTSRGQGHGGRIVAAATDFIRSSGADLGGLFTGPHQTGFYARFGWEHITSPTFIGDKPFEAAKMMIFVSEKGRAARASFEWEPLTIEHAW